MDVDWPICRAQDGRNSARISFRRFAPPPEIRSFVESLWTFEASPQGKTLTDYILPDIGSEIICQMDGHAFIRGPRLHLEEIAIEPGARYRGARLRPGVGDSFSSLPRERRVERAWRSRIRVARLQHPHRKGSPAFWLTSSSVAVSSAAGLPCARRISWRAHMAGTPSMPSQRRSAARPAIFIAR